MKIDFDNLSETARWLVVAIVSQAPEGTAWPKDLPSDYRPAIRISVNDHEIDTTKFVSRVAMAIDETIVRQSAGRAEDRFESAYGALIDYLDEHVRRAADDIEQHLKENFPGLRKENDDD